MTQAAISPTTVNRRAGLGAWLLYLPLASWLLILVVAPALILVLYSFCDRDEFGQVVWSFTLENYKRIFSPALLPMFAWAIGLAAVCGTVVADLRRAARVGFAIVFCAISPTPSANRTSRQPTSEFSGAPPNSPPSAPRSAC